MRQKVRKKCAQSFATKLLVKYNFNLYYKTSYFAYFSPNFTHFFFLINLTVNWLQITGMQ